MRMMTFKRIPKFFITLVLIFILLGSLGVSFSEEYSQKTFDFSTPSELNTIISTNTQYVDFEFTITNTHNELQEFNISILGDLKWSIDYDDSNIRLATGQSKTVNFRVSTPQELGYKRIVDSQGLSKFELDDEYFGEFDFTAKVDVLNSDDDFEIVYSLDVYSPTNLPVDFELSPSSLYVSPKDPISIRVSAFNLDEELGVSTEMSAQVFVDSTPITLDKFDVSFSTQQAVKDIQFSIPQTIAPGNYDVLIEVKIDSGDGKKKSWELNEVIEILEFQDLQASYDKKYSFWAFQEIITIQNFGNVDSVFEHKVDLNWYEKIFYSTQMDVSIIDSQHVFSSTIKAGETKEVDISFRYGIILLILIVVCIIFGIRTYQQYKNPIEVELDFSNVKKVKHEGIKSFKVKLGFENIRREEIETLRVIFRMPGYLHVKDESFSLTPPTKVLKGSSKYKLIWEFKRFEKGDSRILGFELMNSKGILGDIHFEDLEFEVKINGKINRYFTKVKSING